MPINSGFRDVFGVRCIALIGACCVIAATCSVILAGDRRERSSSLIDREVFDGKTLFEKSWEPGKPSPKGGDGVGPLYNEVSCVACHNQGGTGGAGAKEHDVEMLTAVDATPESLRDRKIYQGELHDLHPGFWDRTSIVVHRYAVDDDMQKRLHKVWSFDAVQAPGQTKIIRKSRRNTPALFGAGLIDAIPDAVLRGAEKRTFASFPEIKGRGSALPDGSVGRFGWKGQISSLDTFVRAACSNELGLEVPGHHQASFASPSAKTAANVNLDLDEEECKTITAFLLHLRPPLQRSPEGRTALPWGYTVFESVGCATCHAPTLGDVQGIYSDLLLHDIGDAFMESATGYGSGSPTVRSVRDVADANGPAKRSGMADAIEWRTPPLWGIADSAPYFHDGRAGTLDDAIRLHAGEASKTTKRYTKLSPSDRKAMLSFLSTLKVSPEIKKTASKARRRSRGI